MAECAITYCDEPAVKAVQNGGVRLHVCHNHGSVYDPLPPATPKSAPDGSTGTSEHYTRGGA
jgi:hypothetical protein